MSVRFHLPNFVDRFNGSMNMTLISMIKRMPRMFYDGVEIASVFDCFPMIWNGGRIMAGYMDMQTVDKLVPQYLGRFNSLGVPCRLTLTNPLLTREHLNDPVCNRVLDIADNGMNEAIVFSPPAGGAYQEASPKYEDNLLHLQADKRSANIGKRA